MAGSLETGVRRVVVKVDGEEVLDYYNSEDVIEVVIEKERSTRD
jgi:hypothetical protein